VKKIVIVGSGAVAAEVTSYIEDGDFGSKENMVIKGYIDYNFNKEKYWKRYNFAQEILGDVNSYRILEEDNFVVCISDISFRSKIIEILRKRGANFINIIHPTSLISKNIIIGQGNIIYPFCQIGPKAQMGDFNFMTHNTTISHDCIVGSNNFIGGDGLCGHVRLGNNNFLGVRSIVLPHVKIGNDNIIQAGMVVDKNIKDKTTIFYRFKEQILAIPNAD
jgi:sugar O-acyltransferase (sialic acid O-acetyltransferase NeuD family)